MGSTQDGLVETNLGTLFWSLDERLVTTLQSREEEMKRSPTKRWMAGLAPVLAVVGGLMLVPTAAEATVEQGHPELVINFVKNSGTHVGNIGWGPIKLNSPALSTEIECLNLGFGYAANEGSPLTAQGQILGWEASGDASKTGTELDRECHFKKGTAVVEAWATDEPVLEQTGTLGKRGTPLTVPWDVEARCGEREETDTAIIKIGTPVGAAVKNGCKTEEEEKTEIEAEETGRTGCYATTVPAGCIKVDIVQPSLALETDFQGSLRPKGKEGSAPLSPSRWTFEGATSGNLRLTTAFATTGTTTGEVKETGFGTELVQLK